MNRRIETALRASTTSGSMISGRKRTSCMLKAISFKLIVVLSSQSYNLCCICIWCVCSWKKLGWCVSYSIYTDEQTYIVLAFIRNTTRVYSHWSKNRMYVSRQVCMCVHANEIISQTNTYNTVVSLTMMEWMCVCHSFVDETTMSERSKCYSNILHHMTRPGSILRGVQIY
jgi:hypothetical protein